MAGGNSMSERLARLEDFPGVPLSKDDIPIANQDQALCDGLVLVKWTTVAGLLSGREGHSKLKIPEPKLYDRAKVTKDLENFLRDMEQYFRAAHIDVVEQVSITSRIEVGSHDAERGKNSGKNHKGKDKNKKNDNKNGNGDAKYNRQSEGVGDKGCFICGGPHFARQCPKKERIIALRVNEENEKTNEGNDEVQVSVNPMRLVTLRTEKFVEGDGLMYVKALMNGKAVMVMVETGATNSFIGMECVEELGLS
ncbi:hypothetical protein AgCh_004066 [Apium graveolens]